MPVCGCGVRRGDAVPCISIRGSHSERHRALLPSMVGSYYPSRVLALRSPGCRGQAGYLAALSGNRCNPPKPCTCQIEFPRCPPLHAWTRPDWTTAWVSYSAWLPATTRYSASTEGASMCSQGSQARKVMAGPASVLAR